MNTKLQAFLYLLVRDHLSTGKVETLLETVQGVEHTGVDFSCPLVAELAYKWADELSLAVPAAPISHPVLHNRRFVVPAVDF